MREIKYGEDHGEPIEICPICKCVNVHVRKITQPNENVPGYEVAADVRIYFWGECGHEWIREWHTYKGCTFVNFYILKEEKI